MLRTMVKMSVLAVLLVPLSGMSLYYNCGCLTGYDVTLYDDSVLPADGSTILEDEVTVQMTGVQANWGSPCVNMGASVRKWDPIRGWVGLSIWGDWEVDNCVPNPNHTNGDICDLTITWPNVPLTTGENRFQFEIWADGCDSCDSDWAYVEVTYYH